MGLGWAMPTLLNQFLDNVTATGESHGHQRFSSDSWGSLDSFMPIADDCTSYRWRWEVWSYSPAYYLVCPSPFLAASPPRLIEKVQYLDKIVYTFLTSY